MRKLHIDIETGDPDDLWTLAFMSTHPKFDLQGVTVYPGGRDQIGLVKKVLQLCGRDDVPVGANVRDDGKARVGKYYFNWLGKIEPCDPDEDVVGVFAQTQGGDLLTGGPLSNIKAMVGSTNISDVKLFKRWTLQGGYVGCNIQLPEFTIPKFVGLDAVPTFNLNGDPKAAQYLLVSHDNCAEEIQMVGKNVCHGFWISKDNSARHTLSQIPKGKHQGLDVMLSGMEKYCEKKPEGKAAHDILAALLHIAPLHGKWVNGSPFRRKGKWGFVEAQEPTNINALVTVDGDAVMQEFA
jgi:pyrimidine-specific ribonucleoside hydrolase